MHCKLHEGWLLAAGHLVAGGGGAAVEGGVLLGALQRGRAQAAQRVLAQLVGAVQTRAHQS